MLATDSVEKQKLVLKSGKIMVLENDFVQRITTESIPLVELE